MKAQSLYEYIISFMIFLIIAIFLLKTMSDIGVESAYKFEENSECLQAENILEYSSGFSSSISKIGLSDSLNKINYSKWNNISNENYLDLKARTLITYPFKLKYLIKEIPLNKTDLEPSLKPNETETSGNLIRTSNGIKFYAGSQNQSAVLNLILKTYDENTQVNLISDPCVAGGSLEAEDSISTPDGKVIFTISITPEDLDCFEVTFTPQESYLYIDYLKFTDPSGEKEYPIFISDNFEINDVIGSESIDESPCNKRKIVILNADNENFITYLEASSWK